MHKAIWLLVITFFLQVVAQENVTKDNQAKEDRVQRVYKIRMGDKTIKIKLSGSVAAMRRVIAKESEARENMLKVHEEMAKIQKHLKELYAVIDCDNDELERSYIKWVRWNKKAIKQHRHHLAVLKKLQDSMPVSKVEDKEVPTEVTEPEEQKNTQLSLDYKDFDIREALESVAIAANRSLTISDRVQGKITIQLENVTWLEALEAIANNSGYIVVQEENGTIRVVHPQEVDHSNSNVEPEIEELNSPQEIVLGEKDRVSAEFNNTDIREAISRIASLTNQTIIVASNVLGNVTLKLEDVTWLEALEAVATEGGYVLIQEQDNLIRIVHPRELRRRGSNVQLRANDKINVDFQDVEVTEIAKKIAKLVGKDIVISDKVSGKVSLQREDVTCIEVLEALTTEGGYIMVQQENGTIQILHPSEIEPTDKQPSDATPVEKVVPVEKIPEIPPTNPEKPADNQPTEATTPVEKPADNQPTEATTPVEKPADNQPADTTTPPTEVAPVDPEKSSGGN